MVKGAKVVRGQRPKTIFGRAKADRASLRIGIEFSTGFASEGLDRTEGTEGEGGRGQGESRRGSLRPLQGRASCVLTSTATICGAC